MIISLKTFLDEGYFGNIELGNSYAEVSCFLEKPDEIGHFKKNISIYKYKDLQLTFGNAGLIFIGLYFLERQIYLPEPITLGENFPNFPITLQEFAIALKNESIVTNKYKPLTFGNQDCLISRIGVHIMFKNHVLDSFQYGAVNQKT
jgi:hypothetical protein